MIPIIFDSTATDFSTNGIGRLVDAISCTVTEERNGSFELELEYPIQGQHYNYLSYSMIILAKPSNKATFQAFRIYEMSKPLNGQVTIKARHISYQLSYIPTVPFSADTAIGALNGLKSYATENCPFTFESDVTTAGSFIFQVPYSIRSLLGGQDGSVLDTFGGEYEWDNWRVILHSSRGSNNGVVLRYGKNITDLTQEESIENTITGIFPYWYKEVSSTVDTGDDDSDTDTSTSSETTTTQVLVKLDSPVQSDNAGNFPYHLTEVKDFTSEFENEPTTDQLKEYTEQYIKENNIGVPTVSVDVSFVNLRETEEYKDYAVLQDVNLCDTVTVYFEDLGVSTTAKVNKTEYDVLNERYNSIEVGDPSSDLSSTIESQLEEISQRPTYDEAQESVDRATGVLNSGIRGHVIINRTNDGWANEILFLDNSDINQAQEVLRINQKGIGFSSNGYKGPYYQSWTMDGHLALGGVNNNYGTFEILSAEGKTLGQWDNEGLALYDSDGNKLIKITSSGLYLLDTDGTDMAHMDQDGLTINEGTINLKRKNDIGIYADGDVVRIGDFEVNDAYGRQIFESSDEKTGMSGEPDEDEGLYLWANYNSEDDYSFVVNSGDAYVMHGGTPYPIGETLASLVDRVDSLQDQIDNLDSGDDEEEEPSK